MSRKTELQKLQKSIKNKGNPFGVTLLHFLQLDWPDSDVVISRMKAFLQTSGIHEDEILHLTLTITESSLKAYGATLFSVSRSKKNLDPFRVAVFVDRILYALTEQLESGIGVKRELTAVIDTESGLPVWCATKLLSSDERDHLRTFMYQNFVKDELKQALRRSDYEQAILDGAFDFVHTDSSCDATCAG